MQRSYMCMWSRNSAIFSGPKLVLNEVENCSVDKKTRNLKYFLENLDSFRLKKRGTISEDALVPVELKACTFGTIDFERYMQVLEQQTVGSNLDNTVPSSSACIPNFHQLKTFGAS